MTLAEQMQPTPAASDDGSLLDGLRAELRDLFAGTVDSARVVAEFEAKLAAERERQHATAEALREQIAVLEYAAAEELPSASSETPRLVDLIDGNRRNPAAAGAALDGAWGDFGAFVRTAINATRRGGSTDERIRLINESGDIRADLTGEEIELGGALVPEEFRAQLLELMVQPATIRSRATVLPMGSSSLTLPMIRDTDHSNQSIYGGVQTYWTESGAEIAETEPEFAQTQLTARGLAAITPVNNTLLADSAITVPAIIGRMLMTASMWTEERTFIRGDGVGKPLGVLNSDCLVEVTRDSDSDKVGEVNLVDIAKMEAALLPESQPHAAYFICPALIEDLIRLTAGDVQAWQTNLAAGRPTTLQGRPVIVNEHMSSRGDRGDILLADWRFYLVGDRQAMSLASSEHARFSRNQTLLRGVCRVDGQPWMAGPLTPANGDGALSPFVTLSD